MGLHSFHFYIEQEVLEQLLLSGCVIILPVFIESLDTPITQVRRKISYFSHTYCIVLQSPIAYYYRIALGTISFILAHNTTII